MLANAGNAAATFAVGPPSDAHFSLTQAAGVLLAPGGTWTMSVDFTATDTADVYATSAVSVSGATCASSLETVTYSGAGTTGLITGWPSSIDFGAADCGALRPPRAASR